MAIWTIKHWLFRRFSRIISIWNLQHGLTWFRMYQNSLQRNVAPTLFTFLIIWWIKNKLKLLNSSFKFGESRLLKSFEKVKIPVIIVGVQATVTTEVVEYDIPLHLSKEVMKTEIDFQEDKINIFGKKVKIHFPSTGHYCIKLKSKLSDENVFKTNAVLLCSNVQNLSNTKKYIVALKLHWQLSHPHSERLLSLLQDWNKWWRIKISYKSFRWIVWLTATGLEPTTT